MRILSIIFLIVFICGLYGLVLRDHRGFPDETSFVACYSGHEAVYNEQASNLIVHGGDVTFTDSQGDKVRMVNMPCVFFIKNKAAPQKSN